MTSTDSEPKAALSRQAVWSLGLSLGGLLCVGPLASIPAIVLGHRAKAVSGSEGGRLRGRGLAQAGLWIGYASLLLQAALVAATLLVEPVSYYWKSRTSEPNYELHLTMGDPACSAEAVARVLTRRLRDARVPHRMDVAAPGAVRVRLTAESRMPIEEIRELLVRPARLEFRLVDARNKELSSRLLDQGMAPEGYRVVRAGREAFYERAPGRVGEKDSPEHRERLARFGAPDDDCELLLERTYRDGEFLFKPCYVKRRCELSGAFIKEARVDYDPTGRPMIAIEFDERGTRAFATMTADYAPGGDRNPDPGTTRQLAIVLDGTLFSAPVIREAIHGGRAVINGSFSVAEATRQAKALQAGPLPCPVAIAEEIRLAP